MASRLWSQLQESSVKETDEEAEGDSHRQKGGDAEEEDGMEHEGMAGVSKGG